MKEKLLKKIKDKTLTIGVIGLGYVGLILDLDSNITGREFHG